METELTRYHVCNDYSLEKFKSGDGVVGRIKWVNCEIHGVKGQVGYEKGNGPVYFRTESTKNLSGKYL